MTPVCVLSCDVHIRLLMCRKSIVSVPQDPSPSHNSTFNQTSNVPSIHIYICICLGQYNVFITDLYSVTPPAHITHISINKMSHTLKNAAGIHDHVSSEKKKKKK